MARRSSVVQWGIRTALLIVCAFVITAAPARAQQDAGIIGVVTDESGAILPGVTVTAKSPALQVASMAAVTDTRGEYRITPLPIGTYTIEFSLSGFQTIRREGIRLTVGFTAKVDEAMKVGSLEESITVSGAAPVVDVKSTTTSTQLTRETIELLPTSRNGIVSVLAQAPGVRTLRDTGGSSLNTVPTYRVFGQAGEPFSTLEGVQTSSIQASGGQANYWDYTTVEEAAVRTIGNSAEVPSRGVNLNAVVKSGGNDFHGSGSSNYTNESLQSDNIDAKLKAAGIDSGDGLERRTNLNGDVGGRIVRDKLWFYGALRRVENYEKPLNTFKSDGSAAVAQDYAWYHTEKLSYQLSQSNRFVGFYQFNNKYDPASTLNQFHGWDYRGGITTFDSTGKIEWQKTYGTSLVTSLQYGHWQYNSVYWNFSPAGTPASRDNRTLIETGPQTTVGQRPNNPRHHVKGSATWFRPDLLLGNHEFKFGGDYMSEWFGRQYPDLPADEKDSHGAFTSVNAYPNYRLIFSGGAPFQVEFWNNPTYARGDVRYFDSYFQDSWSIHRKLTLNLGVRYAHDNGFVQAKCRPAAFGASATVFPAECTSERQFNIWNPVTPRLHASYDVSGNGKTVIKGGYGLFAHRRHLNPEVDAVDPQVRTTSTFRWRDTNGNRAYDPGEINLDPNGADFVSQSGGSNTVPNPNEKEPFASEAYVSVERELMANFAVRSSFIYSTTDSYRTVNTLRPYDAYSVVIQSRDPGPDGVVGNADDGGLVTRYEYPTSLRGRAFERFTLANDPAAEQKFTSLDFAVFKRLSNHWQLLASYSATKRNVPYVFMSSTGAVSEFDSNTLAADLNPNAEINTADKEWEWTAKFSGVYQLPYNILLSGNLEHRGGYPWARQVLFTGGTTIPSITLNVEPIGTRRLPSTDQLDLRTEKTFKLTQSHRIGVQLNVFNVLNSNTVISVVRQSGTTFGLPTSIMEPRIVEFGLTYHF